MQRAVFTADPKKGFIATGLAPADEKRETRFGTLDVTLLLALVGVAIAVARHLLAR